MTGACHAPVIYGHLEFYYRNGFPFGNIGENPFEKLGLISAISKIHTGADPFGQTEGGHPDNHVGARIPVEHRASGVTEAGSAADSGIVGRLKIEAAGQCASEIDQSRRRHESFAKR